MSRHQHLAVCLIFLTLPCCGADLAEIVSRGTATLKADWAADADYAFVEKDEVEKGGKRTSKTSQVVYIDGSDYYLPLGIDGQPEKAELDKLKNEVRRRNAETPEERRKRIEKYKKERDENEALVLDFPNAFNFELLREETIDGHPAYVLSGTPKKRTGHPSLAAKVLSGMQGTLWVDQENFHAIRVECDVMTPVPIYGILAKVLPGTHIELGMAPVSDSTWLVSGLSMNLKVAKLMLFKSAQLTRSTYTNYRLNSLVLEELLR
jgi:hypothetical protein